MRPFAHGVGVVAAAALLSLTAACAESGGSTGTPAPPSASAPSDAGQNAGAAAGNARSTVVAATFAQDDAAVNYDKALVPDGAKALVAENVFDGSTTVTLAVKGLRPNRAYGAHAHAKPCGPVGDDAGPHFQHVADPVTPSVDPNYANPVNEVWLDFTTDAQGNAAVARSVPWTFTDARAGSVVIHAQSTQTGPGTAGMAGARAACVSVGF